MSFEEIDDEDIERVLGTHQEEINRATMQLEGERRGAYALALLRKIYSTQKGIIITDAFAESLAMIMRYTGENNYHPEFAGNNCRPAEPKQQTEGHVPDSIFGSELISEKSLDEVILMYMAEDMAEDDAESMMEIAARMKKTASASSDGPPDGEGRKRKNTTSLVETDHRKVPRPDLRAASSSELKQKMLYDYATEKVGRMMKGDGIRLPIIPWRQGGNISPPGKDEYPCPNFPLLASRDPETVIYLIEEIAKLDNNNPWIPLLVRSFVYAARDSERLPLYDFEYGTIKELMTKVRPLRPTESKMDAMRRVLRNSRRSEDAQTAFAKLYTIALANKAEQISEIEECLNLDIPGYLIVSKISDEGASSDVYFAFDEVLIASKKDPETRVNSDHRVAIKLMRDEEATGHVLKDSQNSGASSLRNMFMTDIANLERLTHPNIARLFGKGIYGDRIYVVQPYYERGSLEHNLKNVDFWMTGEKILQGLAYIHDQGLVHRDIKPANIFVTGDSNLAVIGDLQTCKPVALKDDNIATMFTHGRSHASPQLLLTHKATYQDDVFSMGLVLWRMFTGKNVPFDYNPNSIKESRYGEVYEAHKQKMAYMLTEMGPSQPELRELVLNCVNFNPEMRYENAQQLLAAFRYARAKVQPRETAEMLYPMTGGSKEVLKEMMKIHKSELKEKKKKE